MVDIIQQDMRQVKKKSDTPKFKYDEVPWQNIAQSGAAQFS